MVAWKVSFNAMASPCHLMLVAPTQEDAERIAEPAIAEVRRIETDYSRYRADSIVSRINAAAGNGKWITLEDEASSLLDYATSLFAISGGLFDITSGVLRRAWNFKVPRIPSSEELEPLLALVGWHKVERRRGAVRLQKPGMELDFGGFGKEYAADRAAAVLRALGVQHGYVNLGGDISVIGPQPDGEPWLIGIQDPRNADRTIASLAVARGGLATSGDYERYFELDARRYCHILDPRSGMPVTYWRSVSVLAPLAVAAGSTTTIAMLLGADAPRFLEQSGFSWLAQDADGRLHSQRC
ncbi:FAD:protein FMN transferase [Pseudoduganella sp. UC29_106]|uniref:FAD:protein FMN transferase n=1 Tax=Pseudoduganella sp. UC29_106 TaxID=3374553 RepID=UPI0037584B58